VNNIIILAMSCHSLFHHLCDHHNCHYHHS